MSESTETRAAVPFVGRERPLSRLFAAYEVVRMGRTVAAYVSGPSGIGKTALVQRFTRELRVGGEALVLEGRCYERETVPYQALDSLVGGLVAALDELPPEEQQAVLPIGVRALARLFPVLQRLPAVVQRNEPTEELAPDPQERRQRASRALRGLLDRLARRRPLVWVIDDLQWGDADSGLLLHELLRPPDPPPFLLVGCYQSDRADDGPLLHALLDERVGEGPVTDVRGIELGPLAEGDIVRLAALILGRDEDEVRAGAGVVAREAGGNPYLACELVRQWRRAGTGSLSEPTLETLLAGRLADLDAPRRALLDVLAVAGRPVTPELAARALELETEASAAFAALRDDHLVRGGVQGEGRRVELYHGRLREALLAALAPERVAALHRRLAEAIETTDGGDRNALLDHLLGAGQPERAASIAADLAREAAEALAFEQAAQLYRQALALSAADSETRRSWQVALGGALVNAGRGAQAARVFLEAASAASPEGARDLERRAAEQLLRTGHVDEGLSLLGRVLNDLGLGLTRGPRRAVALLLLRQLRLRVRGMGFRPREESEIPPATLARIDACWSGAVGLGLVDSIRGAELQTRGLLMALRAGEPYRIARALAIEVSYLASASNWERRRARRLLELVSRLADESGHPHARGLLLLAQGMTEFFEGRWPDAKRYCDAAEEQLRERCVGAAWEMNAARIFGMGSRYYLGEVADLCERVPRLLKEQEDRGDLFASVSLRGDVPNIIWLAADDPARARREIDESMAAWSRQGFHIQHYWRLLAETRIDLYEGDGAAAFERVESHWALLRRSLLLRVQIIRVFSLHLRARAALAAARRSSEPWTLLALARRDVKHLLRERLPMVDGLAHLVEAGVVRAQGDLDGTRRLLELALHELESTGMTLFHAAAVHRLGELVGGDEGALLLRESQEAMRRQRIRQPDKMTDMLAPGPFATARR